VGQRPIGDVALLRLLLPDRDGVIRRRTSGRAGGPRASSSGSSPAGADRPGAGVIASKPPLYHWLGAVSVASRARPTRRSAFVGGGHLGLAIAPSQPAWRRPPPRGLRRPAVDHQVLAAGSRRASMPSPRASRPRSQLAWWYRDRPARPYRRHPRARRRSDERPAGAPRPSSSSRPAARGSRALRRCGAGAALAAGTLVVGWYAFACVRGGRN
jgi:hypothetical protein